MRTSTKISNKEQAFITILVAVFLYVSACLWFPSKRDYIYTPPKVDTVITKKPIAILKIKKDKIVLPKKVIVYKKDTTIRKKIEKETIITGITINRHIPILRRMDYIEVSKVDTLGLAFKDKYSISDFKEISIDNIGNVSISKRKKNIRKIAIIATSVAVVAIGGKIVINNIKLR